MRPEELQASSEQEYEEVHEDSFGDFIRDDDNDLQYDDNPVITHTYLTTSNLSKQ